MLIDEVATPEITIGWERRRNLEPDANHATTGFLAAERQESKLFASPTDSQRSSAFTFKLKHSSEGRECLNVENHEVENDPKASKKLKTGQGVPNVEMLFATWSAGFNEVTILDVLCDMIKEICRAKI